MINVADGIDLIFRYRRLRTEDKMKQEAPVAVLILGVFRDLQKVCQANDWLFAIAVSIFIPIAVGVKPPLGTPRPRSNSGSSSRSGSCGHGRSRSRRGGRSRTRSSSRSIGGGSGGRGRGSGASVLLLAPLHQEEQGLGGSLRLPSLVSEP